MTTDTKKTDSTMVPDLIAGLTTGIANIQDAMASGVLAGVNPVQGLYAIMVGTPLGAIFGSSTYMNVAATSALAITAGSALAGYSSGDPRDTAISTLAHRLLTERHAGELVAQELTDAQKQLGEITGEVTSDDLLGRIFSSFCIGK